MIMSSNVWPDLSCFTFLLSGYNNNKIMELSLERFFLLLGSDNEVIAASLDRIRSLAASEETLELQPLRFGKYR